MPAPLNQVAVSTGAKGVAPGYTTDFKAAVRPVAHSNYDKSSATHCPVTGLPFVYLWPWGQRRTHCELCGKAVSVQAVTTTHPLVPNGMRTCETCTNVAVPQACGLFACDWFHGAISRDEAEMRLKQSHSAIGDFLVRVAGKSEGEDVAYFISVRGTPRDVRHIPIFGGPRTWGLRSLEELPTLQALIDDHCGKDDVLDRPALVESEAEVVPCCTCNESVEGEFCLACGTRMKTAEAFAHKYHAVGRAYLQLETAA